MARRKRKASQSTVEVQHEARNEAHHRSSRIRAPAAVSSNTHQAPIKNSVDREKEPKSMMNGASSRAADVGGDVGDEADVSSPHNSDVDTEYHDGGNDIGSENDCEPGDDTDQGCPMSRSANDP